MSRIGYKLSHHKQQMWVYLIAGLFVCDFVLCGYIPSRQRLVALQRTQAQQRQTIAMAAGQGTELADLQERLHSMETAVERFDRQVPVDRALGTFLQQIAGIMESCRLREQVVLPGKESKAGPLNCVPIHVACKGTLADLFAFFMKLQTLDRLVRFEKISMENDPDLTGQISLRLEAVIFEQLAKPRPGPDSAESKSAGGVNHGA